MLDGALCSRQADFKEYVDWLMLAARGSRVSLRLTCFYTPRTLLKGPASAAVEAYAQSPAPEKVRIMVLDRNQIKLMAAARGQGSGTADRDATKDLLGRNNFRHLWANYEALKGATHERRWPVLLEDFAFIDDRYIIAYIGKLFGGNPCLIMSVEPRLAERARSLFRLCSPDVYKDLVFDSFEALCRACPT
jgi:hypothetical protein